MKREIYNKNTLPPLKPYRNWIWRIILVDKDGFYTFDDYSLTYLKLCIIDKLIKVIDQDRVFLTLRKMHHGKRYRTASKELKPKEGYKYRLTIVTKEGKIYQKDFTHTVELSPEIPKINRDILMPAIKVRRFE